MTETSATTLIAEAGKQETVLTRVFAAPRELVYQALTQPEHVPHWFGPAYLTTEVDTMDVQPGGQWRYVQTAPDGTQHAFHGFYHQVSPPERLVYTFEYEGEPGHVVLETVTLEDLGSQTRLITSAVFQTLADRDAMMRAGMETGAKEGWDRLAKLLATISA